MRGDRITDVGDPRPAAGEAVVTRVGRLRPAIDTHSHGDRGLFEHRDALAAVSQGITTIVAGQDGGSPGCPIARLQREPAAVNVASYVGHGRIRYEVMGEISAARPPRRGGRMRALLEREMRGRTGLSTGLEYDPGSIRRRPR